MVFQSLALFPHRSVGENIEFPLKMRGVGREARRERAMELLHQLRLPEAYYAKTSPSARAASASASRWPARSPTTRRSCSSTSPLSAIDYKLRKTLEKELKDIHARPARPSSTSPTASRRPW
jgi:spermidine/putrescine transport system ATP-binding protein